MQTLAFAKQELTKYLRKMTAQEGDISLHVNENLSAHAYDNLININVNSGSGTITGSSEQSVLIAVYELLRRCGCAFLRPGELGEYIPHKDIADISCTLKHKASKRYRGVCIEGATSLETILGILDFLPKVGMNSYFMQFREGYNFFERWYTHTGNTLVEPESFDLERCRSLIRPIVEAAKLRGIIYQGVGHGFTCEAFGVSGLGWIEMKDAWPEEHRYALAMKNGVRDLAWDMPLITALCYSNEAVQKIVVDSAADYINQHRELDVVHFWLDDGHNNKCECDNCKDTIVSEYYVTMLNMLDRRLTELGCNTKIVFLAYHETLWPPKAHIINPERFIFMFAPIQRSFTEVVPTIDEVCEPLPYNLNDQPLPKNNAEMMTFLKTWCSYFDETDYTKGKELDAFDFDYYLNNYSDAGQLELARIIYDDIHNMSKNKLNGIINCQSQRIFMAMGFQMYVMCRALFDESVSFDAIAEEYFTGSYGVHAQDMLERAKKLTAASECMRGRGNDFDKLLAVINEPLPNYGELDATQQRSFELFALYMQLYAKYASMIKTYEANDKDSAKAQFTDLKQLVMETDLKYPTEFEQYYFLDKMKRLVKELSE